jgi:hypothetical protein
LPPSVVDPPESATAPPLSAGSGLFSTLEQDKNAPNAEHNARKEVRVMGKVCLGAKGRADRLRVDNQVEPWAFESS